MSAQEKLRKLINDKNAPYLNNYISSQNLSSFNSMKVLEFYRKYVNHFF